MGRPLSPAVLPYPLDITTGTPRGFYYFDLLGCTLNGNLNPADVTGVGEPPILPDDQLTVDDIIAFVNAFSDGEGCPGTAPCNLADVCGVGGLPEPPEGELTVDDVIQFFNAFSDGCG